MAKFNKLTREAVRALPPGKMLSEHGIRAEKKRDGDVRWVVDAKVRGIRVHQAIGYESEKVARSDAEAFLEKQRTKIREEGVPDTSGRGKLLTVAEAFEDYLASEERAGAKDMGRKRAHWRDHISKALGSRVIASIKPKDMSEFRQSLLNKGLAEATANRVGSTWSKFTNWLAENDMVAKLVPKMKGVDESRFARDFALTQEQAKELVAAAEADENPHILAFVLIGFASSLRHREIVRIKASDIDWDRCRVRVLVKRGRYRSAALTPGLCEYLQEYRKTLPDPNGWLFPSTRTDNGHTDRMNLQFARCVKAIGLDPHVVTPHTMRHSAATWFSAACHGDMKLLMEFTGHLSMKMALRYTHPTGEAVDSVLAKLNGESHHKVTIGDQPKGEEERPDA